MIGPPMGLLLPQSTLASPWFLLLSLIVAFNTIIYVGLTLFKLIPWPRQFHPARIRRWMRRHGSDVEKDPAMTDIPVPIARESDDPYEELRGTIAKRDIPQAFGLVGAILVVFAIASIFTSRNREVGFHVAEFSMAVLFFILATVTGRRRFRARIVMRTWIVACVVLGLGLYAESWVLESVYPLAYSLIVMTAYAPIALAWRPTIIAGALLLAVMPFVIARVRGDEDWRLFAAAAAAILVGGALLRLRLVAISALADERAKSGAVASTDVLTGALTRHGLLSLMPSMAATAERVGEPVCLMFFDIERLAEANKQYGMAYGDEVIKAVARSVQEQVRQGDLLARWGGDEFLVVGLGGKPSADLLARRIQNAVRMTGVNLGKWPTTVRIGTAAGDPRETTFEQLLSEATETLRSSVE